MNNVFSASFEKQRRMVYIVNELYNKGKVSLKKLPGFNVDPKTISRHINDLKDRFGDDIIYTKRDGFYHIKSEKLPELEEIISELDKSTGYLNATIFKINNVNKSKFVLLDIATSDNGSEYLDDLYYAIENKCKVTINYQPFGKEEYKDEITPLIIKEYKQRWYILLKNSKKEIRVYSLDRIKKLKVLFEKKHKLNITPYRKQFHNIIGVSLSEKEPEEVHIWISPVQADYVKSLPLHHSQNILKDDENGLIVCLNVVINWELKEEILKRGAYAKALKPLSLANELNEEHKKASQIYQKEVLEEINC